MKAKKLILYLMLLSAAIGFAACGEDGNDINQDKATETVTPGISGAVDAPDPETAIEGVGLFGMSSALNVYKADENGKETDEPMAHRAEISSETEFVFYVELRIDSALGHEDEPVPTALYIIADGIPVPFEVIGEDQGKGLRFTYPFESGVTYSIPIKVDADENTGEITLLCDPYYDYVLEEDENYTLCDHISYQMYNAACVKEGVLPETEEKYYVDYVDDPIDGGRMHFNPLSSEEDTVAPNSLGLAGIAEAIETSEDSLYIRFVGDCFADDGDGQKALGAYYSVMVFCDGELMAPFEGENHCFVQTPGAGGRMWEYPIDISGITKGRHAFTAVAVPFYCDEMNSETIVGFDDVSTGKIAVTIK